MKEKTMRILIIVITIVIVIAVISALFVICWGEYQKDRKNRDYRERSMQSERQNIEQILTEIRELEAGIPSLEKWASLFRSWKRLGVLINSNSFQKIKTEFVNRGYTFWMIREKLHENGLLLAQKIWENPDDIDLMVDVNRLIFPRTYIWFESPISAMEFVVKIMELSDPEKIGLSWETIKRVTLERTIAKIKKWRSLDLKSGDSNRRENLLELEKAALWYYDPVALDLSQEELLRVAVSLQVDKSDEFADIHDFVKRRLNLRGGE